MLQLQASRSCVMHGVSVRVKRSRSSLAEKLVCSAPLPKSTTVPERPCFDTCLWKIRSSMEPTNTHTHTMILFTDDKNAPKYLTKKKLATSDVSVTVSTCKTLPHLVGKHRRLLNYFVDLIENLELRVSHVLFI